MLQLGYSKSALDAIRGSAFKWGYKAAKAGFQVSGTPTVGSIAVWDGDYSYGGKNKGSSGHVAIVERVYDDGSIDISEANWSLSRYDTRLHISKYEPSKFIVIPKG
jgi:surface antigen